MNKTDLLDLVLEKLMGDMDDMEGTSAMAHGADDCPDPLGCSQHDDDRGEALAGDGEPAAVKVEVSKLGLPSLDGAKDEDGGKAGDELSPEEAEALRKLLANK